MKYYLYISDAKIEMLYPQIPHDFKARINTEIGVDLKFVKASRTTEREVEENSFTKLAAIVSYIEQSGLVGSVTEPRDYVRDTLSMRFAPWGRKGNDVHLGSPFALSPGTAQFVCFASKFEVGSVSVALWGSWKHMVGHDNKGEFSMSTSMGAFALWDLIDRLNPDNEWRATATEEERAYFDRLRKRASDWRQMRVNAFATPADDISASLMLAMIVNSELKGPEQKLEFMAKRFASSLPGSNRPYFVGTPLYVAVAD